MTLSYYLTIIITIWDQRSILVSVKPKKKTTRKGDQTPGPGAISSTWIHTSGLQLEDNNINFLNFFP